MGLKYLLFCCLVLIVFVGSNNSLGYAISEELLVAMAKRLKDYIANRNFNMIARVGEDEFALLNIGLKDANDVLNQAEDLYRQLIKPFEINNAKVCSTVSIGIALNHNHNQEPEKILRWADTAMQYARVNFAKTSVFV